MPTCLALPVFVVLLATPSAGAVPPCSCANLAEMKYRIQEARELINGYAAESARIGRGPTYTEAAYRAFNAGPMKTRLAGLSARNPNHPHTEGARTDPMSCNPEIPTGVSVCLQKALEIHEGHHQVACQQRKGHFDTLIAPNTDYREGRPLAEAYEEEVAAYKDEASFLREQIDALPEECKPPGWILTWEVQIRGEGGSTGKSPFKWKVDRMYSGTAELLLRLPLKKDMMQFSNPAAMQKLMGMSLQEKKDLKARMQKNASWSVKTPTVPVTVSVDDEIVNFTHETGEGGEVTFQDTTKTQRWKGKGPDELHGGASISFDDDVASGTFNLTLDLQLLGLIDQVTHLQREDIRRSAGGFGDKPTEVIETPPTRAPFSTMKVPEFEGLVTGMKLHHLVDLPRTIVGGKLRFDSNWQHVKPLTAPFTTWPQADKNLKIRVAYVLEKPE
jgi:hypothetical protein